MSNNSKKNELLPTRLNEEPAIFRGSTLSELMMLALSGAIIWIPFWLVVCWFFGFLMMGVGIGVLSIIGWVFVGGTFLQKAKRGRPLGFYQVRLKLMLEDYKLRKTGFIRQSQIWALGRNRSNTK